MFCAWYSLEVVFFHSSSLPVVWPLFSEMIRAVCRVR